MSRNERIARRLLSLLFLASSIQRCHGATPHLASSPPTLQSSQSPQSPLSSLTDLISEARSSNRKIVVVTGGVLSGIGKGVVASSTGVLLRAMGLRVTALKIDPYLNVDAGLMSPFEHGEVFVLDDGGECDLDLGNYERFLSVSLTKKSNLTTGKIYLSVIERERVGDYLGKTVQIIPHISDAIQEWVLQVAKTPVNDDNSSPQVCIVELGGTLGDIESMPFVEALRQLQEQIGYKNMCFIHVSLIPVLGTPVSEQKTKPTQHSVKQMAQLGLSPDFICCRGTQPLLKETKNKISMFTGVSPNAIISVHDVPNIYWVPIMMMNQGMPDMLLNRLRISLPRIHTQDTHKHIHHYAQETDGPATRHVEQTQLIQNWKELATSVDHPGEECVIAMVGKYCDHGDAYASVVKALTHAAIATKQKLRIEWIVADDLDKIDNQEVLDLLESCHGILVPGGFGSRGIQGKIQAIQHARTSKTPFLGICLGMQLAVVEYAQNVLKIPQAYSSEFRDGLEPDKQDFIIFMPEGDKDRMGGTMRLGARETVLRKGSLARMLYQDSETIMERHRHRYEVNPKLVEALEAKGLHFVGRNNDGTGERMEVVELDREDGHPYFIASQFHPEFTSRPGRPNPLFLGLLQAAAINRKKMQGEEAS